MALRNALSCKTQRSKQEQFTISTRACHGPAVCKTKALHAMDQAQAPMSALRHNHMLERSPFLDAMLRSGERSGEVYFLRTRLRRASQRHFDAVVTFDAGQ